MNHIDFITSVLITVAWIWGFEYTFKEGEIFGRPGQWMRANLPDWFLKPTIDCKYCMSSVHGTVFFMAFYPELLVIDPPLSIMIWWGVFLFSCCGTTAILDNK